MTEETSQSLDSLQQYRVWASTPIDQPPTYSVVIPTYNEEIRIVPTIGAIATHMCTLGEPWELIISDDGSNDSTVQLVNDLGLANLRVVPAKINAGKGDAVRRGMLASLGETVLFADADQSTPIEQFERLADQIRLGADVVVGSRAADGAEVSNKSMARKAFSAGLRFVVMGVFRIPVADTQCGFKMFTRESADLLFERQLIDDFSFDLEVLYLSQKFGLKTVEVPVEWIDAPGSTVNPTKVALGFLRDLATIKKNDRDGKYDRPTTPTSRVQATDEADPPTTQLAA